MRHLTCTQPQIAAPNPAAGEGAAHACPASHSALQIARAAIARWSGSPAAGSTLARDVARVSPQARWVAEAQCGLADWIARGGFSQSDDPLADAPLATPQLYQLSAIKPSRLSPNLNACID